MIVKLTRSQIDILEYLLEEAKETLPEDHPNDPDIRRSLLKKYERIEDIFKKADLDNRYKLAGFKVIKNPKYGRK